MHLFRTNSGPVVKKEDSFFPVNRDWDELLNDNQLFACLSQITVNETPNPELQLEIDRALKPIVNQEVWAAGVTYFRSKTARMDESQETGGGDFYDRVYEAERPEIFFKATASRTVGHKESMSLRSDSNWIVPEPELTLAINSRGSIVGYTIGNDLSCRDIEGENPLYLPQAKTFDRCAAIGPGILVSDGALSDETKIELEVIRSNESVVTDSTTLAQMKRQLDELVGFLFRTNSFPHGCFLMTGTGIVPPDDFCLQKNDVCRISISGIGTLENSMA